MTKQYVHPSSLKDLPLKPATQDRIELIGELGRRKDAILNSPVFDLVKARELLKDYEDADMPSAADNLRRRIEYYQEKLEDITV